MPCDSGPSYDQIESEHQRIRGFVVGLCIACETLAKFSLLPMLLLPWYRAHQAADKARGARDQTRMELRDLEKAAKAAGFSGLDTAHPARKAYTAASWAVAVAEREEQFEAVQLSRLKPEPLP